MRLPVLAPVFGAANDALTPFLWPFLRDLTAFLTIFISGLDLTLDLELFVTLGMGAYLPWFLGLGNTDLGAGQFAPIGGNHQSFCAMAPASSRWAARSWPMVSRSRSVTVPSSRLWKSTVTQNGVP